MSLFSRAPTAGVAESCIDFRYNKPWRPMKRDVPILRRLGKQPNQRSRVDFHRRLAVIFVPIAAADLAGCASILGAVYNEHYHTPGSSIIWKVTVKGAGAKDVQALVLRTLAQTAGVEAATISGEIYADMRWVEPAHGLWPATSCHLQFVPRVNWFDDSTAEVYFPVNYFENGDANRIGAAARQRFEALVGSLEQALSQWELSKESVTQV